MTFLLFKNEDEVEKHMSCMLFMFVMLWLSRSRYTEIPTKIVFRKKMVSIRFGFQVWLCFL